MFSHKITFEDQNWGIKIFPFFREEIPAEPDFKAVSTNCLCLRICACERLIDLYLAKNAIQIQRRKHLL